MTELTFRKKNDEIWKNLNLKIELINRNDLDMVVRCEEILMETDIAIRNLKATVQKYKFVDWSDEIGFFKNTKPKFIAIYIYYSNILAIEAAKPYADPEIIKEYYGKERTNLLFFYNEHKEFISYYRRKATYLDKKYFVRFKFDFKLKLSAELYSYDQEFSTSHDHIVSQVLANDMLDQYLSKKIDLKDADESYRLENKGLEWTAPKTALIELLYALHQTKCFNSGQVDLSEVVRWAEKSLNINLGNFYKTFGEIRMRKNDRAKFVSLLQQNLNSILDDLDE